MSVGQTLRRAREAQARSLEQVHSRTRISINLLRAIEADDLSTVSSAFMYRSFVRQFAEAVEIDPSQLEPAMQAAVQQIPALLMPGEKARAAPFKVPALAIGKRRSFRWLQSLASLTMVLIVCSAVYAYWQDARAYWQSGKSGAAAGVSQQMSQSRAEASVTQASSPSASPGQILPRRAVNNAGAGFTVELSATEPAWLSIVTDGRESFKGILERAETKMLAGRQSARVRTGNAGALEAVFNGKPIGALGSPGQVRTVVFTRDNYRVLDSPAKASWWGTTASGVLNPLPLPALLLFPMRAVPHS